MAGNTQFTYSGQARENAILQGLLAQGWPLDEAQRLAAEQAGPSQGDIAVGRVLLWLGGGCIAFILVLWVLTLISMA